MSANERLRRDPIGLVWEHLAEERVAMIGTPEAARPLRPMSLNVSPEECAIWIFTRADGEFAREVGDGGRSHLVSMGKDGSTQVSIVGRIEPSHSALHIERYWTPLVAAWFDRGRDDPAVLLMRFTPQTGTVWVSSGGILAAGWEIAKASLIGERPDLGDTADLVFTAVI